MYKCLIVDDEPNAHEVIKHYLAQDSELQLTAQAFNAIEAQAILQEKSIDIVFLDVNMPEITGLQLLVQNKINACVILTTAYSEFALDGFDLGVIDYLLKPIPPARFETAIIKAKKLLQVEKLERFIIFKINGLNIKFLYSEILYFESVSNYLKIHTTQKYYLALGTLSDLENNLHHQYFIRIHKSYIVNKTFANLKPNKSAILLQQMELPIGRTFKSAVCSMLQSP